MTTTDEVAMTTTDEVAMTTTDEVAMTPPRLRRASRCGMCKQIGHSRDNCPYTPIAQRIFAAEYHALRRQESMLVRSRETSVNIQNERVHGVTRCKAQIQNILFENAEKIPDGLYKELMDSLLIED